MSNNTKHTPGPWNFVPNKTNKNGHEKDYLGGIYSGEWWVAAVEKVVDAETPDAPLANAKLIAAAPELLVVCRELLEIYKKYANDNPQEDHTADYAIDVIKKATE